MRTLYQQVNLYQPIFRKQRKIFSAVAMAQITAIMAVALLAIYAYGYMGVMALEAEAVRLEGREKAFATQLASLDQSSSIQRRRAVEDELERLNATLLDQQKLVEVLRDRPLGSTEGFSPYLLALARSHQDGLWLTHIRINGSTDAIELIGEARDVERVPEYLLRLGRQEALIGQRFDEFEIEREEPGRPVRFRVSSRRAYEPTYQRGLASR